MDHRIASDQEREWAGQPAVEVHKLTCLTIQPGDTLIARMNVSITDETLRGLREKLEKALPGVKIVLLDRDIEVVGVRKGEPDRAAERGVAAT